MIVSFFTLILSWCTTKKISQNDSISVNECKNRGGIVSSQLSVNNLPADELQKKLASWTAEFSISCPQWKNKVSNISSEKWAIEWEICCK
jgi:hypothetical protein